MTEREAFFKRWSLRKSEPAEEEATDRVEAEEETADLPDVESLGRESDYSVFLRKGVPSALRKQALRKLWRLDPAFSKLDGLVEYGEDYAAKAFGAGAAQAAQEIGRRVARADGDSAGKRRHDEPEAGDDVEDDDTSREAEGTSSQS